MVSRGKGRRSHAPSGEEKPGRYEKVAVSLPSELAKSIREQVRARGIPSFSAYMAEAARKELESTEFENLLDEMFREQPMSDREKEWANRALYE